jgi:hypothetical protein
MCETQSCGFEPLKLLRIVFPCSDSTDLRGAPIRPGLRESISVKSTTLTRPKSIKPIIRPGMGVQLLIRELIRGAIRLLFHLRSKCLDQKIPSPCQANQLRHPLWYNRCFAGSSLHYMSSTNDFHIGKERHIVRNQTSL